MGRHSSDLPLESGSMTTSPQKWVEVTCTAALLDGAKKINVVNAANGLPTDQYKIRNVVLIGGGTNFGAGGDRLLSLLDGTTTWTTIANADIETAPSASLHYGDTKVPYLTSKFNVASVAGSSIYFAYSGGTTDHSGTGSISFAVLLEKVA